MLEAIVDGSHKDPFSVLGPHLKGPHWEVYTFQPQAASVRVVEQTGATTVMQRVHDAGGGSYQALINSALREHIQSSGEPLEDTLRRVLREELSHTG